MTKSTVAGRLRMCFSPDGSVLQQIEIGFSGEQTWMYRPESPKPLSSEEIEFFKKLDVSIDNEA